ncbi:MAG: ribonuclease HI [Firmicutes bacterium]|nr:ribonuclease HI [Bacillota bacterium]
MTEVHIYTDGACSGNPGPGGWAAILVAGTREKELSGGEKHTTNQRMEIKAAVEGLLALTRPCDVVLYSDSAYLVNCMQQKWYAKWQRSGWINSQGQPVKNQDLWELLLQAVGEHTVRFDKVKGHSGHTYNERCDELARQAVKSL